jgi:hypothetical protein
MRGIHGSPVAIVWYDNPRDVRRQRAILWAVWRRFRQEWLLFRAAHASGALYARAARPAIGAGLGHFLSFGRGVVVQLVRTLPCHAILLFSCI